MVSQPYAQSGGGLAYKRRQRLWSIATALVCLLSIWFFHYSSRIIPTQQSGNAEVPQSVSASAAANSVSPFDVKSARDKPFSTSATSSTQTLPPEVSLLVAAGQYKRANTKLLALASAAVERQDDPALASALSHLGEVALLQGDLDSAELYLAEALAFYNELEDEIAAAGVNLQFGRLHLIARQRARLAANAYDTLLLARWNISQGQFHGIESELHRVAKTNLSLNRFAAAASVYETLYKGYSAQGDYTQAQSAGSEAIKLLAASGREHDALTMLQHMRDEGFSGSFFTALQSQVEAIVREYRNSELTISAARDAMQLFHQLLARGDVVSAWRFRQQADRLLAGASARAQYRRQSDVLVELYNSNSSMENAKSSLRQAHEVFMRYGMDLQVVRDLQSEIF